MTLIENTQMGDWLRIGKKGIVELLISYGLKDVCLLATKMKENGQEGAPIFKEVIALCKEKRARRKNKQPRTR